MLCQFDKWCATSARVLLDCLYTSASNAGFRLGQATLNSAYQPEMPNRAEIRGTAGAEFSVHAFQYFHSLSFHLCTVWLFVTTLGYCDAS
jgi:hypothetical protein